MKKSLIILTLLLLSAVANADCKYNGNIYPTGAVIGGMTCQADGSWK